MRVICVFRKCYLQRIRVAVFGAAFLCMIIISGCASSTTNERFLLEFRDSRMFQGAPVVINYSCVRRLSANSGTSDAGYRPEFSQIRVTGKSSDDILIIEGSEAQDAAFCSEFEDRYHPESKLGSSKLRVKIFRRKNGRWYFDNRTQIQWRALFFSKQIEEDYLRVIRRTTNRDSGQKSGNFDFQFLNNLSSDETSQDILVSPSIRVIKIERYNFVSEAEHEKIASKIFSWMLVSGSRKENWSVDKCRLKKLLDAVKPYQKIAWSQSTVSCAARETVPPGIGLERLNVLLSNALPMALLEGNSWTAPAAATFFSAPIESFSGWVNPTVPARIGNNSPLYWDFVSKIKYAPYRGGQQEIFEFNEPTPGLSSFLLKDDGGSKIILMDGEFRIIKSPKLPTLTQGNQDVEQ